MITSLLEIYILAQLSAFDEEAVSFRSWDPTTVLTAESMPVHDGIHIAPIIEAKSAVVVDLDTGISLYEKDVYAPMPIASITKIMTAIIVLEENQLDETVVVSKNAARTTGSKMWLYQGEKIKVKDLLLGILIHSANDAAVALAEHNAGTVEDFVKKMNIKAEDLGLNATNFANPIGFDDQNNYSTIYDLSLMSRYAFRKEFLRQAVNIKELEVRSIDGKIKHDLKNTNSLLGSEFFNVKGLKTGRTDEAGLCLVGVAENDKSQRVLTIVLNSPDRFRETKILIDWVFRAYKW